MKDIFYSELAKSPGEHYKLVKDIYNEAFADDERVPFERLQHWLAGLHSNASATLVAVMDGGTVVGMGSAIYFSQKNIGYLPYLAVRSDLRGQGYGQQIVLWLLGWIEQKARLVDNGAPRMTFWEVRDPSDAPNEEERNLRLRLIGFYSRLGARTIPITYICPPISEGFSEVPYVPMIRTYPLSKGLNREDALDVAWLGLVEINGVKPGSHLWAKTLQSIDVNWSNDAYVK